MIPVWIEEIDRAALDALIDNAVPEGKTIEYKQERCGARPTEISTRVDRCSDVVRKHRRGGFSSSASRPSKGVPARPARRIEIEDLGWGETTAGSTCC